MINEKPRSSEIGNENNSKHCVRDSALWLVQKLAGLCFWLWALALSVSAFSYTLLPFVTLGMCNITTSTGWFNVEHVTCESFLGSEVIEIVTFFSMMAVLLAYEGISNLAFIMGSDTWFHFIIATTVGLAIYHAIRWVRKKVRD